MKKSKHHPKFAFENSRNINLDKFTGRRLLYWIGMKSNSLVIRRFITAYVVRKWSKGSAWDKECLCFWLPIFLKEGLINIQFINQMKIDI